jgi:hypothetical protein
MRTMEARAPRPCGHKPVERQTDGEKDAQSRECIELNPGDRGQIKSGSRFQFVPARVRRPCLRFYVREVSTIKGSLGGGTTIGAGA